MHAFTKLEMVIICRSLLWENLCMIINVINHMQLRALWEQVWKSWQHRTLSIPSVLCSQFAFIASGYCVFSGHHCGIFKGSGVTIRGSRLHTFVSGWHARSQRVCQAVLGAPCQAESQPAETAAAGHYIYTSLNFYYYCLTLGFVVFIHTEDN